MIGVCLLAVVSCAMAAITKATTTSAATSTQTTPIAINSKLRKALLEALSNYDGDDSTESDEETSTVSSVTEDFDDATDNPSFIKIHTFAIDGDKSDENEVIKTIIITRPRTTLTPPKGAPNDSAKDQVHIKFKSPDPVSEKSDNNQLTRRVEARNADNVSEKKDDKSKKKASEKSVTKPITPQTATTTLPPPVEVDGNNEKVDKEDVKIFQAPLLAAFTVQQDINGNANKVISLFKNSQQSDVTNKKIVNMEFRASQPLPAVHPTSAPLTTVQAQQQENNNNQQLLTAFELKQRQLEEQIRFLQARQREQEEIIRQHQFRQDQQTRQSQFQEQRNRFDEEQRQRQRFEEEQRQRQRYEQEQQFLLRQQQSQALQQPQTQPLQAPPSPNVNVQFIPSIPLGHTVGISVEQQLPFKGPGEFNPDKPGLQKSFGQLQQQFQFKQFQNQQQNQQFQQQQTQQQQQQQIQQQQQQIQEQQQRSNIGSGFVQQQQLPVAQPLIQKHEVQQLQAFSPLPTNLELPVRQSQNFGQFTQLPHNLELPQKPFQTFNSAPLSVLPSITELAPQGQSRNRVFRNDASQTGNFGFNDQVQIQQQQINPIQYTLDNQLQNYFRQSGINTRSAEDFRLISKILALNHGVPNNHFQPNGGRFL